MLWIGRGGTVRAISEAATTYDVRMEIRSAEHRSLEGGITAWVAPERPRRISLGWSAMLSEDAAHVAALGQGPGPVGLIDTTDPGTVLSRAAVTGRAATSADHWAVVSTTAGRIVQSGGAWYIEAYGGSGTAGVVWRHPVLTRWPVLPGMTVRFETPVQWPDSSTTELRWYSLAGSVIGTSTGDYAVSATAPPGAVSFTVTAHVPRLPAPLLYPLGGAELLYDGGTTVLAGTGYGPLTVTALSVSPVYGQAHLRDVSLALVEVSDGAQS